MPCLNPLPQFPASPRCLKPCLNLLPQPLASSPRLKSSPQVPASNLCLNPPPPYLRPPLPLLRPDMQLFLFLELCPFCCSGLTGALHSALDDHTTIIPRNHNGLCQNYLYHDHTLQNTHVSSRRNDDSLWLF